MTIGCLAGGAGKRDDGDFSAHDATSRGTTGGLTRPILDVFPDFRDDHRAFAHR